MCLADQATQEALPVQQPEPDWPEGMEPPQDDWEHVRNWWGCFGSEALGRKKSLRLKRRGPPGRRLTTELKTYDVPQILNACRLVVFGASTRGVTLRVRRGDTTSLMTVLRHIETYAELWEAERDQRGLPDEPERLPQEERAALRRITMGRAPDAPSTRRPDNFKLPQRSAAEPAVTAAQAQEYPAWVQTVASILIAGYFDADHSEYFDPRPEQMDAWRWLVDHGNLGVPWVAPEDRPKVAKAVLLDVAPPTDPRAIRVLALLSRRGETVAEGEMVAELYPDASTRTAGVYIRRAAASLVESGLAVIVEDVGWRLAPGRGDRPERPPPDGEGAQVIELAQVVGGAS